MWYVVFLAVILLILLRPGRTKKYTGNQKYIDRLLKKHRCYQSKHFMTAREREFFVNSAVRSRDPLAGDGAGPSG